MIKEAFPDKFIAAISKQVIDHADEIDAKKESEDTKNEPTEENEDEPDEEEITDVCRDEEEEEIDEELERQKDIEARKKASRYRRNEKKVEVFPGEHFLDRKLLLKQFFKFPIEGKKWMEILRIDN